MADYSSVLNDALQLSEPERLKLLDALWEMIPADADLPLHPSWGPELERRVAALETGAAETIPWEKIRAEALDRIRHGNQS
jgi:putative addiction module component (TIGR02574 family)